MVNWLNESFSKNLSSGNLNWNSVFNFLVIYKRISNNLLSVNRTFDLFLSNYRCLDNSLLDNGLRNNSFVDNRLSDDSFKYFGLTHNLLSLGDGWFWIKNLVSILDSFQNLLLSFLLTCSSGSVSSFTLRILLNLFH